MLKKTVSLTQFFWVPTKYFWLINKTHSYPEPYRMIPGGNFGRLIPQYLMAKNLSRWCLLIFSAYHLLKSSTSSTLTVLWSALITSAIYWNMLKLKMKQFHNPKSFIRQLTWVFYNLFGSYQKIFGSFLQQNTSGRIFHYFSKTRNRRICLNMEFTFYKHGLWEKRRSY